MEKKKVFCVWVSLLLIFTSCSSDELGEVKQKKDFTPQHSALAEHADSYLSKIIGKYKNEIDTIYHYEEDMYVSQRSKSENIDRTKNSIEIEMAFPSQRKTEVLFKTGESIDVCDTSCIYQGDIIISERDIDILAGVTPIEEEGIQLRGALLNYSKYKWKDGIIRYQFQSDFILRTEVREATQEWKRACPFLTFIELPDNDKSKVDKILFFHGDGSFSKLGRQGGTQKISLDRKNATAGTAMHEIGHALGMIHEHCRFPQHISLSIYWDNIKYSRKKNYREVRDRILIGAVTEPIGSPIDFNSVMMYPSYSGDAIDTYKPVMLKKDGGVIIAQRDYVSSGDASTVRLFYTGSIF